SFANSQEINELKENSQHSPILEIFNSFTLCEPFSSPSVERNFLTDVSNHSPPLRRGRGWGLGSLKKRMTAKGRPFRQSTVHSLFAS
ncbi:MAG: hypothetical protein J6W69_01760, partial [Bacteroidales bacterium]|nr:hypothetical protein [Bacteroidales bacterium]